MECGVCDIRSSIGFCIECQKLLCETCSESCDACGKLMCPEHVHESRSGKVYCVGCDQRRKADRKDKHRKHHGEGVEMGGTGLDALTGGSAMAAEEEVDENRVLGKRDPVQPWKLCMYSAVAAFGLAMVLMIFPTLRRIPLGGTSYLATPYVLIIIPLIATFWGVYGIVNIEFYKFRQRCYAGLGIAVLSMVMFVVAVASDPVAREEDQSVEVQERRQIMNDQQLEGWRENVLDKYK